MKKKVVVLIAALLIAILAGGLFVYKLKNPNTYIAAEGNKSLSRESESTRDSVNYIVSDDRYFHISLDDVITIFKDITYNQNKYTSIFENETLLYLKELHDKYGVIASGYVYYELDDSFNLSDCTDRYKEEFRQNSDWLRFGFHTVNGSTNYANAENKDIVNDYNKVIMELYRITGSYECIDNVIRLQNFAGNVDCIKAINSTD